MPTTIHITPREETVIKAIVAGRSNAEIAQQLCLSVKTVEFYITRLLRKLNGRSRIDIARWWLQQGKEGVEDDMIECKLKDEHRRST